MVLVIRPEITTFSNFSHAQHFSRASTLPSRLVSLLSLSLSCPSPPALKVHSKVDCGSRTDCCCTRRQTKTKENGVRIHDDHSCQTGMDAPGVTRLLCCGAVFFHTQTRRTKWQLGNCKQRASRNVPNSLRAAIVHLPLSNSRRKAVSCVNVFDGFSILRKFC